MAVLAGSLCLLLLAGMSPESVAQSTIGTDSPDSGFEWRQALFESRTLPLIAHETQGFRDIELRLRAEIRLHAASVSIVDQREAAFQLFHRRSTAFAGPQSFPGLGDLLAVEPEFFAGKPVTCFGTFVREAAGDPTGDDQDASAEADHRVAWVRSGFEFPRWLLVDLPASALDSESFPQPEQPCEVVGYFLKLTRVPVDGELQSAAVLIATRLPAVGPRVPPDARMRVTSRTPLQSIENSSYYRTLRQAQLIETSRLHAAAKAFRDQRIKATVQENPKVFSRFVEQPQTFPVYVDLFRHPEAYPGQPVRLQGRVRDVVQFPADPNPYGIERLYEVRMFPDDGQRYPAIIVCSSLPPDFPMDAGIVDRVRVTGLFFKIYAYQGQQEGAQNKLVTRFAPMILADRIEWSGGELQTESRTSWWYGVAVFVILAGLIPSLFVIRNWIADRRGRTQRRRAIPAAVFLPEFEGEPSGPAGGIDADKSDESKEQSDARRE